MEIPYFYVRKHLNNPQIPSLTPSVIHLEFLIRIPIVLSGNLLSNMVFHGGVWSSLSHYAPHGPMIWSSVVSHYPGGLPMKPYASQ